MRSEKTLLLSLLACVGCFDPEVIDPAANAETEAVPETTTGSTTDPMPPGSTSGESSGVGPTAEDGSSTTEPAMSETGMEPECSGDSECEDADPCSIDSCDDGECRHVPDTDDPTCSCDDAADCTQLPPDDACQQRVCTDHVCGLQYTAEGTPLPDTEQTAEDCQIVVCDGEGGSQSIDDDVDVPVDGIDCTADECNDGVPSNPPLAEGTDCAAGLCNASGQCVGCNQAADCGGESTYCSTVICEDGVCGVDETAAGTAVPDQTANDCQEIQCDGKGNAAPVADDADLPADDGNACTDEVCTDGTPSHPAATGAVCNDGLFCTATDACNADGECVGTGDPCSPADGDNDCSETCDEVANACTANDPNGSACNDGLFCNGTDTCSGGSCSVHAGNPCPGPDGDGNCAESCSESADACTASDPSGSACNDGVFCNGTDTCSGGSCSAHTGNPCPGADNDTDCSESCNEAADACTANDPNGTDCGLCSTCLNGACNDTCATLCCPGDICQPAGTVCQ